MTHAEHIKTSSAKNIVFVCEGGIGKVIAATAVVRRIKEEFPDKRVIVVTGYPDIFLNNPNVYRVFRFDNPLYFYDDFITPESYIIKVEPYVGYDYLFQDKHMIDAWCEAIGISRNEAKPEMFFPDNEIEAARLFVDKVTNKRAKDFVLFQWTGGILPQEKTDASYMDAQLRMYRRSLPKKTAQKIVNKLITRGFVVGLVQGDNMPELQGDGVVKVNFPIRQTIALLAQSNKFIGIDSFLQHAAECFGLQGVVVWGGTSPARLGYPDHVNLAKKACPTPHCHRPDSYLFDMNPANGIWNCPHSQKCLDFNVDEILEAYEGLIAKNKKVELEEKKEAALCEA